MNFPTIAILLACLYSVSASTLRGAEPRELGSKKGIKICKKIADGVFETRVVGQWVPMFEANVVRGSCKKVCDTLCVDFSSFEASDSNCVCKQDVIPPTEPITTCADLPCAGNQICKDQANSYTCEPVKCANPFGNPCGPNTACKDAPSGFTCTPLVSDICPAGCDANSQCIQGKCECDSGFFRPKPYLGCEVKQDVIPPSKPITTCANLPCAGNQICKDQANSYTCEPVKCANPYGNPCGPNTACKDAPSGFTCTPLVSDICPAGCDANSQCVKGKCECDSGFFRPKPYLGCETKP